MKPSHHNRQEPYFHYLFGVNEEDFYGALDIRSGRAYLFMPRLPPEYAVWMGSIPTPDQVRGEGRGRVGQPSGWPALPGLMGMHAGNRVEVGGWKAVAPPPTHTRQLRPPPGPRHRAGTWPCPAHQLGCTHVPPPPGAGCLCRG